MKIIIDDKIPFIKGVLEPYGEVEYIAGANISKDDVKDADALIIRTRTHCTKELLEGSKIKFIATATIGFDHIDTAYCEQNGIYWTNAAGCNSSSVQQYMASVLIHLAGKHGLSFKKRTLGVIGVGHVGRKVVKLAEALGFRVVLNDPPLARRIGPCGYISLDGIIREADVITLHVPLTYEGEDKTYHLIDENILKRLNPNTILINCSRGEVVDNSALKMALKEKRIAGAVLDVWENEPHPDLELMSLLDIATPHIAGYSADGKANGSAMSVLSLVRFFKLNAQQWFPEIPAPEKPVIPIDCKGKTRQQIFSEAINSVYRVADDDKRLREAPDTFEKLRGSYPIRREFSAYTLELSNSLPDIETPLKKIGFNITLK
ncbi:MAG: 4-phosphoerythronate dehydrogenase PdxB [Bacteroidota bacterium]|nr:4-phosphoerythronate dehydrogenase PdxB [Bacteroidota bacterium]